MLLRLGSWKRRPVAVLAVLGGLLLAAALCVRGLSSHPAGRLDRAGGRRAGARQQRAGEQRGPLRIVSLAPSNTEILFALGVGDRVVGVTDVCDYPTEAKARPKVGAMLSVDVEKVIDREPDLVVATEGQSGYAGALEAAGIRVMVVAPGSVREVLDSILSLADACGCHAAGRRLQEDLERRLADVVSRTDACVRSEGRTRTFVMIDAGSLWTAGPGTFLDELVTLAGGDNIARDAAAGWVCLSEEIILERDPEVIVAVCPGWQERVESPAWAGLSAVRTKRCFAVDPDLVSRPGPRIVEGLARLAAVLHPTAFRPAAPLPPGSQAVRQKER